MSDLEREILQGMKEYFGSDQKRVQHAMKVLEYAKEILAKEKGNYEVIIAAAILHDIGIKECEKKYNSTDGQLQEKEGPPIAREILKGLGVTEEIIEEVCQIIGSHHSSGEVDTLNFKILWDADWLVNLADEYNISDTQKLKELIGKIFLTESGRIKAQQVYFKKNEQS